MTTATERTYDDKLKRLIVALVLLSLSITAWADMAFSTAYTYDVLSRPETVKRYGVVDVSGQTETFGVLDCMRMEYDGAHLTAVTSEVDAVEGRDFYGRTGYADGTYKSRVTRSYNAAGRLTSDGGAMLGSVRYNTLGLPTMMSIASSSPEKAPRKERVYDATGCKLRQRETEYPGGVATLTEDHRYVGHFTFSADSLERMDFDGGYFDSAGKAHFLFTDWQGNVTLDVDADGNIDQHISYYPYGEPWREPKGQRQTLFAAKERQRGQLAGTYDFGPRAFNPIFLSWDSHDRKADKYAETSPWIYCGGNPIRNIDPSGDAWHRVPDEEGDASHFEWVDPKDSYDKDGKLLPNHYEQAILFTKEGSKGAFNPKSTFNIGTSTAIVHLADGTTKEYDACTNPSNAEKYATIPEGSYEAGVGKHRDEYDALRMGDIGTTNFYANFIDLGAPNPAHPETNKAKGINIHKAGINNFTGIGQNNKAVSEGCFVIDRNKWEDFISNFNNPQQKNNIVGISVQR